MKRYEHENTNIDDKFGLLNNEQTEELCMSAIYDNCFAIKFVINPTLKMCKEVIKINPCVIKFIHNATDEIYKYLLERYSGYPVLKYITNQNYDLCIYAVKCNPKNIKYVADQKYLHCAIAVEKDGMALKYIKNPSYKICEKAVNQNWKAIQYVKNQKHDLCVLALNINEEAIMYIHNKTEEYCMMALNKNYEMIKYIPEPSDKIIKYAINKNIKSIEFLEKSDKIYSMALHLDGLLLQHIVNQTIEDCKIAIVQNINSLKFVKNMTDEIIEFSTNVGPNALFHIKNQTLELCEKVYEKHKWGLQYMEYQTYNMCMDYLKRYEYNIYFIKNPTVEMYLLNIKICQGTYKYAFKRLLNTEHVCSNDKRYCHGCSIVDICNKLIEYDPTIFISILRNRNNFKIDINIQKICENAVKVNGYLIFYVPENYINENMIIQAIKSPQFFQIVVSRRGQKVCTASGKNIENLDEKIKLIKFNLDNVLNMLLPKFNIDEIIF